MSDTDTSFEQALTAARPLGAATGSNPAIDMALRVARSWQLRAIADLSGCSAHDVRAWSSREISQLPDATRGRVYDVLGRDEADDHVTFSHGLR